MRITADFPGGNIRLLSCEGDTVRLTPDLRDTQGDWFYWAFRVEGAQGRTLTFTFGQNIVGYAGAAVSHDYVNWNWQYEHRSESTDRFTYSFGPEETRVWFAHDMLYRPERLEAFVRRCGIRQGQLCVSEKGRSVPFLTMGNGARHVVLTARHHACESTGSYVLEGVLQALAGEMPPDMTVFCVPMVDYDGVTDGDQGKNRIPHDHNRDYGSGPALYASVAAVRAYAQQHPVTVALDFHSPWHCGGGNDTVFLVEKGPCQAAIRRFSALLEDCTADCALSYHAGNNAPPNQGWNRDDSPNFGSFMAARESVVLAGTLETCYFGTPDNPFTAENGLRFGERFAEALRRFWRQTYG